MATRYRPSTGESARVMLQSTHLVNLECVAFRHHKMQIWMPSGRDQLASAALSTWHGVSRAIQSLSKKTGQRSFADMLNACDQIGMCYMPPRNGAQKQSHSPIMANEGRGSVCEWHAGIITQVMYVLIRIVVVVGDVQKWDKPGWPVDAVGSCVQDSTDGGKSRQSIHAQWGKACESFAMSSREPSLHKTDNII